MRRPGDHAERLPSGIVTFLFTDVENSTELWAADQVAMSSSLRVHDQILRSAIEARDGYVFTTAGDSFAAAFSRASDAVDAAVAAQAALAAASWTGPALRVRMGLHLGEAEERDGDYFGPVVNQTARLEAAGHGGQILLSDQVRRAAEIATTDLGRHHVRNVPDAVHIHQIGTDAFPALRIVNRSNVPTAPSHMVGRSAELAETVAALGDHRLVTLTAAGGTGKTRLALAVAEVLLDRHGCSVCFVDLSTVHDDDLVADAIGTSLGLELDGGDATDRVIQYLGDTDTVVILDTCEHLVDACADFCATLLARPGASRILATTRELFDLDGERAIRLAPLDAADESSPAVELFVERALAADSTVSLRPEEMATVAELCRRLDGSPLAIELAAARANVMSPAELLDGIDARFELLRSGRRRRSKRTLDDTLEWSYQLLDDEEQHVLRSLGVFAGSFDLDAAASTTDRPRSSVVDTLDSLIAKSLVVNERSEHRARFRLLETTSAYARRTLEERSELVPARNRHLRHFAKLCAPFAVGWCANTRALAVAQDRENIRAAIKWAGESGRWNAAGELLFATAEVLRVQPLDVRAMAVECIAHLASDSPTTLALQNVRINTSVQLDDFGDAMTTAAELERSQHAASRALGLGCRAFWEIHVDPSRGLGTVAEATAAIDDLPPSTGRRQFLAGIEFAAGSAHLFKAEPEQALARFAKVREHIETSAPGTEYLALSFGAAAVAHVMLGNADASLGIADQADEHPSMFLASDAIRAIVHLRTGALDAARPLVREQAAEAVTGRLSRHANDVLLLCALLAEAEGDLASAADLLLNVGMARHVPTIALSIDLAERLGIRGEFDHERMTAALDASGSGRRAIDALRVEMTRRSWLD